MLLSTAQHRGKGGWYQVTPVMRTASPSLLAIWLPEVRRYPIGTRVGEAEGRVVTVKEGRLVEGSAVGCRGEEVGLCDVGKFVRAVLGGKDERLVALVEGIWLGDGVDKITARGRLLGVITGVAEGFAVAAGLKVFTRGPCADCSTDSRAGLTVRPDSEHSTAQDTQHGRSPSHTIAWKYSTFGRDGSPVCMHGVAGDGVPAVEGRVGAEAPAEAELTGQQLAHVRMQEVPVRVAHPLRQPIQSTGIGAHLHHVDRVLLHGRIEAEGGGPT